MIDTEGLPIGTVDVIIPCHNYGHLLADAVKSVLAQEDVAVRVLILDDASTDETARVGSDLADGDERVEFRRHTINRGHIRTYNEGLEWMQAEYVLLLSADDVLTPGSLARAVRVMQAHPDVVLTYGRDIAFSTPQPPWHDARMQPESYRIYSYRELLDTACRLGHTPIQAPTVLVKTDAHRAAGDYLVDLPHSGDTEIWLRIVSHGRVAALDAVQAFRRLHASNMSHGFSPRQRLEEQLRAFETHLAESPLASVEREKYMRLVRQTTAEAAFWSAARLLDSGDRAECAASLAFAVSCDSAIAETRAWSRLQWKRRLGPLAAGLFDRVSRRVRQPAPVRS
jgi:glycosyltransferase involved in cell wall biosynthesis